MEGATTKLADSDSKEWKEWEWSKVQTLYMRNPFGWILGLHQWFSDDPFSTPGYRSIFRGAYSKPPNWDVNHGASIRQVNDFWDLNRSFALLLTWQTMHPLSLFFANQAPICSRRSLSSGNRLPKNSRQSTSPMAFLTAMSLFYKLF